MTNNKHIEHKQISQQTVTTTTAEMSHSMPQLVDIMRPNIINHEREEDEEEADNSSQETVDQQTKQQ